VRCTVRCTGVQRVSALPLISHTLEKMSVGIAQEGRAVNGTENHPDDVQ
jgi:hypothetical protein